MSLFCFSHVLLSEAPVPVHLYGELAQTQEGIKLLDGNGDFKEFVSILYSSQSSSLQKRGALWVLAHIGRTKLGYKELFPKYDVLNLILHTARNCSCLSVRGTCFYALGLICSTRSAARALKCLGWESKRESCICLPVSIKECGIFTINDATHESLWPQACPTIETPKWGDARDEVAKHFTNLSNNLSFDKSVKAIKTLKADSPEAFQDPKLQLFIFQLMENYSYTLPPRRYFHQIFSVFWSVEELRTLSSYPGVHWKIAAEDAAYTPPLNNKAGWATGRRSKRYTSSVRGNVGRRDSVATGMYFLILIFFTFLTESDRS